MNKGHQQQKISWRLNNKRYQWCWGNLPHKTHTKIFWSKNKNNIEQRSALEKIQTLKKKNKKKI